MYEDCPQTNPSIYEIQVSGRLSPELAGWLGDLTLTISHSPTGSAVTSLRGLVADQAALFGILARIRDLGLKLLSVNRVEPDKELDQNPELEQQV